MSRACASCAFFHPAVTNTSTTYTGGWAGECRVAGPRMETKYDIVERLRIFPVVARDDWCGLYGEAEAGE